ncbi:hypothetical protein [Humibacter sp. RRB41]|uniref:hypothetical protein n=1 Tax=Humibacter sp. RRB41 TaxID=2919946 RepID=UPI001FAA83F8|nr:hypothetical protein [Humibacter sp. RRB41]
MEERRDRTRSNIDGLPTRTVAQVIHYGKRRFILDQGLGNETLTRIRDLLRGGASDIVAVAHKDGLSWLVIGPGVPLTIDEIAPEEDQSDHKALKQLGLA